VTVNDRRRPPERSFVKLITSSPRKNLMDDFMRRRSRYSEWPQEHPNYWALPAMATRLAGPYHARLVCPAGNPGRIQEKNGRDLAPPQTYDELRQIAEFFQRTRDRLQEGYMVPISTTERG